jgi:AcrR family transcriptional regulator
MPETARRRRPYAARVPLEERREQVLDAAIRIIVEEGYSRLTIDAIARGAGVTRPVVYGAFDGLGPLTAALLDRQQERALTQLYDVLPERPDLSNPDQFAADTVRRLVATITADPLTWRPVLFAQLGAPSEVRERVAGDWERVRVQIEGLLQLGLATRGGPTLDAEVLSHAVMAVLEHFGRLILDEPDRFDVERLVGTVQGVLRALTPG